MSFYNQVKATKQAARRQRNRTSARLSKMKKEDRFSDLLANNLALTMEYEELVKDLDYMNAAKDAIKDAISAKVQEIGAIPFTKTT
jgi:predicted  nucleic acid-binding Zn-ribbon protein